MANNNCVDSHRTFLIIGGGVFGLSTAWYLLKDERNDVTICDCQDNIAPSRDVSKILRTDYPDPVRMKEVMESKILWDNDPVLSGFFKQTGRVVTYSNARIETMIGIDRARSQLNLPPRKRQAAQLLKELFGSVQDTQNLAIVYNDDDGVVDWTGAMKSVREDCVKNGGRFRDDRVVRMEVDMSGKIRAVVTPRESIDTERTEVILAAGPWIMSLLEVSSIQQPPASRAPIATGIFSFSIGLSNEQWMKYSVLPVISEIGVGEFLCHPKNTCSAKLTWIKPFRNQSGEKAISEPRDVAGTDLAIETMLDARDWIRRRIPDLQKSGTRIRSIHSWWDGVTTDQKPIITRHPKHPNLIIAGGGSYTHAKDLPYIGQIIVEVVNGSKNHPQFGWAESFTDRSFDNQPALRTDLNFRDLELKASEAERVQRWKENTVLDWRI